MIAYTYFSFILYENRDACFPNFSSARTPYLMYDIYTNDRLHGMCFPTVYLHNITLHCEIGLFDSMPGYIKQKLSSINTYW